MASHPLDEQFSILLYQEREDVVDMISISMLRWEENLVECFIPDIQHPITVNTVICSSSPAKDAAHNPYKLLPLLVSFIQGLEAVAGDASHELLDAVVIAYFFRAEVFAMVDK